MACVKRKSGIFLVLFYLGFICFYMRPVLFEFVWNDIHEDVNQNVATIRLKGNNRAFHSIQHKGDNRDFPSIQPEIHNRYVVPLQPKGGDRWFSSLKPKRNDLGAMPDRGFQRVTSDGSLYAYSAYFDPRDDPQLRVFVMCTQPFMNISYTCKVKLKTGEIRHAPGAFSIFLTFLAYKYPYVAGVIKCSLKQCCDDTTQLHSVSIEPSIQDLAEFQKNFTIPLSKLKILKHEFRIMFPGQKTNTLTRCFAPLQKHYNRTNKLIWNIEISRLSGADKFIFYNYSISPSVDKVLRHYMKEGLAEVRVWNIPMKRIYYFGQMIAEHDCLMSQMYATKYVLLADLDEIILPQNDLSVVRMADKIFHYDTETAKSNLGSLTFACLSFIRNIKYDKIRNRVKNVTEAKNLQIEPLLYTTFFTPWADSRKALVIPERVDRLCVHNACFMRNGYKEKRLHPRKAVMLHYRDTPRHMRENTSFNEFYGMLKYSNEVSTAVARRTTLIGK